MADRLNVDALLSSLGERQFEPVPFYVPERDCLYHYFEDVHYHAEWVTDSLTLYRSSEDGHIIGFKIANLRALLSRSRSADRAGCGSAQVASADGPRP